MTKTPRLREAFFLRLSARLSGYIGDEEGAHLVGDLVDVSLEGEMAGVEELHGCVGDVASEGFGSCGNEIGIVLAPDGKERWPAGAEVLVKFRVELYIVGVVEK